jgi:hypothetical protein
MLDPLSPHDLPPPRYLLESDSSDEEGQGYYPHQASSSRQLVERRSVDLTIKATLQDFESAIIGIGQAGRYLARKAGVTGVQGGSQGTVLEVRAGEEVVGKGYELGKELLLVLDDDEGGMDIADKLLGQLRARSWCVGARSR